MILYIIYKVQFMSKSWPLGFPRCSWFFLKISQLTNSQLKGEGKGCDQNMSPHHINMVFDDSKFFSRIWMVPNSMEHGETGEDSGYLSAVGSRFIRVQLGKRFKKENKTNNRVWHLVSILLGIETFLNFLRVSVSVSKILVSKKSLGIGLENI